MKPFQFPEVRVVEASAGSGKTYALAKRYVQLLLSPSLKNIPNPMRQILAITFTNKAAFEMKARILEFLRKIAFKSMLPYEKEEILDPLGINPDEASERVFKLMDELIRNYNFFQVQTIDSFINALLSGCSFKIGLSANFKIKSNYNDLIELSLDKLIDKASSNEKLAHIFKDFLQQYLFLENRTSWFPKKDMLGLMGALFNEVNTFARTLEPYDIVKADLFERKKKILKWMNDLHENIPEGTDKRFLTSFEKFLSKNQKSFDVDQLSRYFARSEFPVNKGVDLSKKVDDLWGKLTKNIRGLCEDQSHGIFNCYIDVFNHVINEFMELSKKEDVLFLPELNKKARALFDEQGVTVEELYYRLATRFTHYLIDEFQDTNPLQWQNFQLMIEEALSKGGTLFYVGDKKQAIYGFRGGDVRLFDQIKNEFGMFNVNLEKLQTNYRSQKNIVEFNNLLFSQDNLIRFTSTINEKTKNKNAVCFTSEDQQDILSMFSDAKQKCLESNSGGYVKVEHVDGKNKDENDVVIREKLLESLEDLSKRFSYKDMAILVRGNAEVECVTSWLMEEGIPIQSERTSNIKKNHLIKEVCSFLQFLNFPIDNLAFASFILGDIFEKASGISNKEIRMFIAQHRDALRKQPDFHLYKEFRVKYSKTWDKLIDEFFKKVGLYPLYELVVSIFSRYDCLQNFYEFQGFFMRFLELIKAQEEENPDIGSFLDYIENFDDEHMYVHMSDQKAITVLTVHKSKGLEFPVVLVPFFGMDIHVGSQGREGQRAYIVDPQEEHLYLKHFKKTYTLFSKEIKEFEIREYKKSFLAELNNIYVALTRAARELVIFIPSKKGRAQNIAKYLIPEGFSELGTKMKCDEQCHEDLAIHEISPSKFENWIDLLKEEFLSTDEMRNRENIVRGEIIHFVFSFLGNLSLFSQKDVRSLIHDAIEETKVNYDLIDDVGALERKIIEILEYEDFKRFFYVPEAEVFQEKEIVDAFGRTKRVDRLIVKKDEVWIVDYKTSEEPLAEHDEQLREYVKLVERLYPKKKVKGFLLYVDKFIVKEIDKDSEK